MNENEMTGYTVAYGRDEAQFPVYVVAFLAATFFAASLVTGQAIWIVLGLLTAAAAFFNYPLIETGRPRFGANQYGIFIEGLGLIRWRSVDRIDLVEVATRAMTSRELQIALRDPLSRALVADWRSRRLPRTLMRLPWSMNHQNVIRIGLEPLDRPPEEIHQAFTRMWRYYRS